MHLTVNALRERVLTCRFVSLAALLLFAGCAEKRPEVDSDLQQKSVSLLQQSDGGHSTYNTSPFTIEMAWFGRGQVTDDVLAEILRGAPQVRVLKMRYSQVTDAGLSVLAEKAPYLEHLEIAGMPLVTDVGLKFLEDLPRLDYLYLMDTGATEEAARALEEKMGLNNMIFKVTDPADAEAAAKSAPGPSESEATPEAEIETAERESNARPADEGSSDKPSLENLDVK
jgi:hypothetical protein